MHQTVFSSSPSLKAMPLFPSGWHWCFATLLHLRLYVFFMLKTSICKSLNGYFYLMEKHIKVWLTIRRLQPSLLIVQCVRRCLCVVYLKNKLSSLPRTLSSPLLSHTAWFLARWENHSQLTALESFRSWTSFSALTRHVWAAAVCCAAHIVYNDYYLCTF